VNPAAFQRRRTLDQKTLIGTIGRNILIGIITAAPLAVTWLIIDFLFNQLSRMGRPWVGAIARGIAPEKPFLASLLQNESFLSILAVATILAALWALGRMTTHVIGQRLIGVFEALIDRIPFVDKIYRATKLLLSVADRAAGGERRVVLIDFPSAEMKAIGLLTHILKDKDTGEQLAAVYVPTSPNPTSGYIEIVPQSKLTVTDWTFDQAMSFVVTGGANSPNTITYSVREATEAFDQSRTLMEC